jgi:hypothetical protein
VHAGTLRSWRDHGQASSWFDYVLEATRNCYWTPLWEVWWKMCNLRFLYTSLHTCVSLWWVQLRILPRLMCYLRRSGSSDTMKDSNIYIEMKWKWRKEAESEEQRMNESVMHREAEDEIIALFYYLLLLNCLHYYFSLYICSIGRYCTENMLSFTLNIMLTNSLLLTNTTNRMLTILIANLLTLDIIRTVDIFTKASPEVFYNIKETSICMCFLPKWWKLLGFDAPCVLLIVCEILNTFVSILYFVHIPW